MFNRRTISYILAILLLVASTSESYTKVGRSKKKNNNNYKSTMVYSPIKYNLLAKANFGYLVDSEDKLGIYIPDGKYFYGFGFAFEYHTDGKHAFGIHYSRFYKDYSTTDENNESITKQYLLKQYTVSWLYKFTTKKTAIPIATIHFGTAKPDFKKASNAKVIKFGLGFIGHTQGKINLRGVFYYQQFFSSIDLEQYTSVDKLNVVGLDVLVGLPL